jgi:hypothetical protein
VLQLLCLTVRGGALLLLLLQGISMGVFSRAAAHWDSGGYGALLSVPACQPGLLAAICPDHELGHLKRTMQDLPDASLVRPRGHMCLVVCLFVCCFGAAMSLL